MNLFIKYFVTLNLILFIGMGTNLNATAVLEDTTTYVYVKIEVKGLSCPFCAYGLEKKLKEIEGATDVEIDIKEGLAMFRIAEAKQPEKEQLRKAVKDAGFTPKAVTFSTIPFKIDKDDK